MPRIGEVIVGVAIAAAIGIVASAFVFVRNQGDDDEAMTILSEPISQQFEVGPGVTVTVESWRGTVNVTPGPAGTVSVEIFRTGAGASEQEAFDNLTRLESRIALDGNVVSARTFRTEDAPATAGTRAPISVTAPADSPLAIVATGPEPVVVEGFTGSISIEAEGPVHLELPRGAPVQLVAETSTGSINDVIGLDGSTAAAGSGTSYTASRGAGGPSITIRAGAGVTIREG
jgi:hypothetical protein